MESVDNQRESLFPSNSKSTSSTSSLRNFLGNKISLSHFLGKKTKQSQATTKPTNKLDLNKKSSTSSTVDKTSVDTLIHTVNFNCNSGFDSSSEITFPKQNKLNKLTQLYHNIDESKNPGNYNNLSEISLDRKTASASTQLINSNNETLLLSYSPLNIHNKNNKLLASSTLNSPSSPTYYNTLNNLSDFKQFNKKKKYESKQGECSQSFTNKLDEIQGVNNSCSQAIPTSMCF